LYQFLKNLKRVAYRMTIAERNIALQIKDLSKAFGPHCALRELSLSFHSGDVVLLLGPNGSGKSTLLKILAGILRPTSGDIIVGGEQIKQIKQQNFKEISYLGHTSALYGPLTVRENLDLLLSLSGNKSDLESIIDTWGLSKYADKAVAELSQGNEFRAALAYAMTKKSQFRYFDEPTSSLDHLGKEVFFKALTKSSSSSAPSSLSIIATHDMRNLGGVVNHVVVLKQGSAVKDLRGDFTDSDLTALYLEACAG